MGTLEKFSDWNFGVGTGRSGAVYNQRDSYFAGIPPMWDWETGCRICFTGNKRMALTTETDDVAVSFYQACGFQSEPFWEKDSDGYGIRYRCSLRKTI